MVFTFLFHITFFSGCVAISGYCERKNLHSVVCCKVQPLSKSSKYHNCFVSLRRYLVSSHDADSSGTRIAQRAERTVCSFRLVTTGNHGYRWYFIETYERVNLNAVCSCIDRVAAQRSPFEISLHPATWRTVRYVNRLTRVTFGYR